ncbi:lysM domain-containing GPI-anchored protein 2-like [Bidens hawaiensis]|uniref:lysM domain-containing GPI-anchored protein 2-like n=1 Tax=Bidens hawaiensis TaxID=980011 RepID=UPI00404B68C0
MKLISSIFSIHSIAQITAPDPGFRCTTTTCNSLIGYKLLPNTTTLSAITKLFEINNFRSLLGANNITPKTQQLNADQILKIPFTPSYVPDDGLYHIAAEVFSRMVTYQQIQSVNNIRDANREIEKMRFWWLSLMAARVWGKRGRKKEREILCVWIEKI